VNKQKPQTNKQTNKKFQGYKWRGSVPINGKWNRHYRDRESIEKNKIKK
jgi:hypothetical protein